MMRDIAFALVSLITLPDCLHPQAGARSQGAENRSVSEESMHHARTILRLGIAVTGGVDRLLQLRTFVTERALVRTDSGQGARPTEPDVIHGAMLTRVDLVSGRVAQLRDLDILGGQVWATRTVAGPDSAFEVNLPSRTYGAFPVRGVVAIRARMQRSEPLLLLLSAWKRQATLRLASGPGAARGEEAITFADADGTVITLIFDQGTHRLLRSEQLVDDVVDGDATRVSAYSEYADTVGFRLPLRTDERSVGGQRWVSRVTRIEVNSPLPDSAFALEPGDVQPPNVPSFRSMEGGVFVYGSDPTSGVVEFNNYLVVLEGYGSSSTAEAAITAITRQFPTKPIRYVVTTHFHSDHVGGLRPYIARGITVLTTADGRIAAERVAKAEHSIRPDTQSIVRRAPRIEVVDRERVLSDGQQEVRLIPIGPTPHVTEMLIAYTPRAQVLFEADLFDLPDGTVVPGGKDTAFLRATLAARGLQIKHIVPVHGRPGTLADLDGSIAAGGRRATCGSQFITRLACFATLAQTRSP